MAKKTISPKEVNLEKVEEILKKYPKEAGFLIPFLQDIQDVYGYLPETVLKEFSQKAGFPLSKIYGVTTFYAQFYLKPQGRYTVKVCRGTACHVRGGKEVQKRVEKDLGLKEGETASDWSFTYETVACLGACALAPVVVVNNSFFGKMSSNKVDALLRKYSR